MSEEIKSFGLILIVSFWEKLFQRMTSINILVVEILMNLKYWVNKNLVSIFKLSVVVAGAHYLECLWTVRLHGPVSHDCKHGEVLQRGEHLVIRDINTVSASVSFAAYCLYKDNPVEWVAQFKRECGQLTDWTNHCILYHSDWLLPSSVTLSVTVFYFNLTNLQNKILFLLDGKSWENFEISLQIVLLYISRLRIEFPRMN